jgi:hypothetical protein
VVDRSSPVVTLPQAQPAARCWVAARAARITARRRHSSSNQAANSLRRLLNLKDEAHYGLLDVSGQDLKTALRQAEDMVTFAEKVLNR